MNIEEFKNKAEDLLSQLEDLVQQIPQKGNTSSECQRMHLQQQINEVYYAVSGTEQSDLEVLPTIEEIEENGRLMSDYETTGYEDVVTGYAEVYEYEGKKYTIIDWNFEAVAYGKEEGKELLITC